MNMETNSIEKRRRHTTYHGNRGDPRMNRALEAREADPQISLVDALLVGGFVFPELNSRKGGNAQKIYDLDGVTLYQRRNQLMRRLRVRSRKKGGTASVESPSLVAHKKRSSQQLEPSNDVLQSKKAVENDRGMVPFDKLTLEDKLFEEMVCPEDEKRERSSLSDKERTSIINDLFGPSENHNLNSCSPVSDDIFKDFEDELNKIHVSKKLALVEAERLCPDLVGRKQKEMFLRSTDFIVKSAVDLFITYWNHRQQLFSDEAFLPLTLERALEKDAVTLQAGIWRILPQRDLHGRALIWVDPSRRNPAIHQAESEARCLWCIIHNALKDETVQEQGFVVLFYAEQGNFYKHFSRRTMELVWSSFKDWLPVKFKAFHMIRAGPTAYVVLSLARVLFVRKIRQRVRFHSGTNDEILASLSAYGIPGSALPVEVGGQFITLQ